MNRHNASKIILGAFFLPAMGTYVLQESEGDKVAGFFIFSFSSLKLDHNP